jgi:hypothetical protein
MKPYSITTKPAPKKTQGPNLIDYLALDLGTGTQEIAFAYVHPEPILEAENQRLFIELSISTGQITEPQTIWMVFGSQNYFLTLASGPWASLTLGLRLQDSTHPAEIMRGGSYEAANHVFILPELVQGTDIQTSLAADQFAVQLLWGNVDIRRFQVKAQYANSIGPLDSGVFFPRF